MLARRSVVQSGTCSALLLLAIKQASAFTPTLSPHIFHQPRAVSSNVWRLALPLAGPKLPHRTSLFASAATIAKSFSVTTTCRSEDQPDMGKSKLPAEDFVQKHVPGDGSCLFHAVSAGLEQGSTAGELRGLAASCLAKQVDAEFNGATLRQWIEWETGLGPAEYAALMRGGGGWGGQIELALLSKCLQRPIQVFSPAQSDGYVLDHEFQPQAGFEGNAPVRVVFSGAHYDALLPKTPTRSAVTMQAEEGSSAMSAQNLYKLFEQRKYRVGQCVEGFPAPKVASSLPSSAPARPCPGLTSIAGR